MLIAHKHISLHTNPYNKSLYDKLFRSRIPFKQTTSETIKNISKHTNNISTSHAVIYSICAKRYIRETQRNQEKRIYGHKQSSKLNYDQKSLYSHMLDHKHALNFSHNISADLTFDLLQVFVEVGNLHKTSNHVLLSPVLILLAITGYKCSVFLYCYSPAVKIEPATSRWLWPKKLREPMPITVTLCILLDNSEWIVGTSKVNENNIKIKNW